MKIKTPDVFEWEGLKSICDKCKSELELEHDDFPIKNTCVLNYDTRRVTYTEWQTQCLKCREWISFISDDDKKKIDDYSVAMNERYRNTK